MEVIPDAVTMAVHRRVWRPAANHVTEWRCAALPGSRCDPAPRSGMRASDPPRISSRVYSAAPGTLDGRDIVGAMGEIPSMDEVLKTGRARERKLEMFLGVVVIAGAVALRFGMASLTDGAYSLLDLGAIAVGVVLLARGLFARS
jgi:hypothetical protein